MSRISIYEAIITLDRAVFTTKEIAATTKRSLSSVSTSLKLIAERGVLSKVGRGIWANPQNPQFNPLSVASFLVNSCTYISFITALHIYGITSQIPKVIYAASPLHTKLVRTPFASYSFHQISPPFFKGFDWYRGEGNFLIATPEKALIDCLYISSRKKNQFLHFPELTFPKNFSFKKAKGWVELIKDNRIRQHVLKHLNENS